MEWTPQEIEQLRALWDEGLSTRTIAARLGTTKNSVVGKAHRLFLPSRPSPIPFAKPGAPRKVRQPPAAPKVTLVAVIRAVAVIPVAPPASVTPRLPRASGECCFPFGHPGKPGFRFCGAPSVPGKPYCRACCSVAYTKPQLSDRVQDTLARKVARQPIVSEFRFRGVARG